MVKINPFAKKKYVLYCKQGKEWTSIAELDTQISLTEAKALYGEDCEQLRLELQDERGKRIKMVWVEPRRKTETVTPLDLLANYKVSLSAVADIIKSTMEIARSVGSTQQQQSIGDKDLEFLKLLLQASRGAQIPQNTQTIQQQPLQNTQLTEADLNKVKEWLEKDELDSENAPCRKNPEKCLENEGVEE